MPVNRIPAPVIRTIPPPVVSTIEVIPPVTDTTPPPITQGLEVPVFDMPDPTIDYPIIDVPTQEEFEAAVEREQQTVEDNNTTPPPPPSTPVIETPPSLNIGGIEIPIPDPAPLVAAGSLAVVTTAVTLASTMVFAQLKNAADPLVRDMLKSKKKKIKIKRVKPVLHFIPNDDGSVEIIEYSSQGMRVVDDNITNLEQYLRDRIDTDSFYEFDNRIIIDDALQKNLTKEGQVRFKRYIKSPKVIAKKLGAKFSI